MSPEWLASGWNTMQPARMLQARRRRIFVHVTETLSHKYRRTPENDSPRGLNDQSCSAPYVLKEDHHVEKVWSCDVVLSLIGGTGLAGICRAGGMVAVRRTQRERRRGCERSRQRRHDCSGLPLWVPGKIGGALQFNGSTYVNCGNQQAFNITRRSHHGGLGPSDPGVRVPDWSGIIMPRRGEHRYLRDLTGTGPASRWASDDADHVELARQWHQFGDRPVQYEMAPRCGNLRRHQRK